MARGNGERLFPPLSLLSPHLLLTHQLSFFALSCPFLPAAPPLLSPSKIFFGWSPSRAAAGAQATVSAVPFCPVSRPTFSRSRLSSPPPVCSPVSSNAPQRLTGFFTCSRRVSSSRQRFHRSLSSPLTRSASSSAGPFPHQILVCSVERRRGFTRPT